MVLSLKHRCDPLMGDLIPGRPGVVLCPLMLDSNSRPQPVEEACWNKVYLQNFSEYLLKQPQSIHYFKS